MLRIIALIALAIAGMAALWYTSLRGLAYYYDAMIFVLAITCAVLLVDTSSNSRSRRPRRVVRDGKGRNAPVIYDSYQIVLPDRALEVGYRRVLYPLVYHGRHRCRENLCRSQQTFDLTDRTLSPLGRTDNRSQERLLAHRPSHARNGGKSPGPPRICGPPPRKSGGEIYTQP